MRPNLADSTLDRGSLMWLAALALVALAMLAALRPAQWPSSEDARQQYRRAAVGRCGQLR